MPLVGGKRSVIGQRSFTGAITGLVDCSGSAYGDTWTTPRLIQRCDYYAKLKKRGVPIVVIPQAMGPFERPDMRAAAQRLFNLCDLVYARDDDSYRHLSELELGDQASIEQAPDVLAGRLPDNPHEWRKRVCIVPNMQMIDRTSADRSEGYLGFLADAAETARDEGLEPWLVLHEVSDRKLVEAVNSRLSNPLPVEDRGALETKGIFACCHSVIGSRFHALVSALSQGTPAIGTSWSRRSSNQETIRGIKGLPLRRRSKAHHPSLCRNRQKWAPPAP